MNNIIKYNGYTIYVWVVAMIDDHIIGEFDSIREAKKEMKGCPCEYMYAAAEEINQNGDVNPAVYGITRKEVLTKIIKLL